MTVIDPTVYKPPVSSGPPTEAPKRDLGSDDFLNLLMTQLGNQDPLNPMETDRFMDQITAMNSLQQQMATNDLLGQLVFATGSLNNQAAVNLVGHEVVAAGDTLQHVSGDSEELVYTLPTEAVDATIEITDDTGRTVRVLTQEELTAGEQTITWDGRDTDGNVLGDGDYTFKVTYRTDPDGEPQSAATYIRGTVDELRFDSGAPVLVINGQQVALPDILRVIGGANDAPNPNDASVADPAAIDEAADLATTGGEVDARLLATLTDLLSNSR